MGNSFIKDGIEFEFIITADDSPSIWMTYPTTSPTTTGPSDSQADTTNPRSNSERMHHSEGALSESIYLYQNLLAQALERNCLPHVLSVGLGCGYNELLTVAYMMQERPLGLLALNIESFENNKYLRESFVNWLQNKTPESDFESQLFLNSTTVLELVAQKMALDPKMLKDQTLFLYKNHQFRVRDELKMETEFENQFGVIYFDAFSTKTNPELWSEAFLDDFLNKAADGACAFATYACTGRLNRAVRRAGFELIKQPGFGSKRESTWAFKGCPLPEEEVSYANENSL